MDCTKIVFSIIPPEFRPKEKVYVMQYEFSGIQSFIFGDVTLFSTKESIQKRSEYVVSATDRMERWLKNRFSKSENFRTLSKSSGKLICAVSHFWTKLSKIQELSDEIQRIIYASTDGRLEMFFGICEARVTLKSRGSDDHNAMSVLAKEANRNKFHCINTLGANKAENILLEFVPPELKTTLTKNPGTDAIMAAIKFDLDNLGSFFQKTESFDERKSASESLAVVLHGAFRNVKDVYPVFIGGDDVFAIASIDSYFQVVAHMYDNIKKGIASHDELKEYRDSFGISGGISFIRSDLGRVPLVYYFEESEEKLMQAKAVSGKNVVAVSNCILNWNQVQILSTILTKYNEEILGDLSAHQRYDMYFNVLELKGRILRIQKNTRKRLLTEEEESNVYNIH